MLFAMLLTLAVFGADMNADASFIGSGVFCGARDQQNNPHGLGKPEWCAPRAVTKPAGPSLRQ